MSKWNVGAIDGELPVVLSSTQVLQYISWSIEETGEQMNLYLRKYFCKFLLHCFAEIVRSYQLTGM